MRHSMIGVFIGLILVSLNCTHLWAQATGQISGAVQDSSGAVLPGAEITATQTDTGVSRMTVTNETGHYVVILSLPLTWQFDMALARTFRIREAQSLEFRAEAFNVLNSFRTAAIETNWSSANYGRIRNALDPRVMQFALKYLF